VFTQDDVEVTFMDIKFSGEELFYEGCSEDWCTHCHIEDNLYTVGSATYSATGTELTAADKIALFSTKLQYSSQCKDYLSSYDYSDADYGGFALFVLKSIGGSLTFQSCSFENFRARTNSLIHVYRGFLTFEDVHFLKTEAGSTSMKVHEDDDKLKVYGIVTASMPSVAKDCSPETCGKVCFWKDKLLPSPDYSRPCADTKFSWSGGSVKYHNHDHNFARSDAASDPKKLQAQLPTNSSASTASCRATRTSQSSTRRSSSWRLSPSLS
jgi:hypothetical protein